VNDKSGFCELTFPATGPKARPLVWPAMRPLPGESAATASPTKRGNWIWVNLWATWCKPCLAEMGLLGRWAKGLRAGGTGLDLELLTIDAPENANALQGRIEAGLPGTVRWVRDEPAFGVFLDGLGVDRAAAIPIHALVDPGGQVRCVRVGAISALDFAAVKGIVTGR
jgi:thiol-disulfide isomerase/thioredoxin